MHATAPPARRLLLVEVPGPWGRTALTDSRLDRYASGRLADAGDAAGVRVLLVRRPGRHAQPQPGTPRAWALADTGPAAVRWGVWRSEHELLDLDLRGPLPPDGPPEARPAGPQRLALVCTHGRHDVCCALRGRPVAQALFYSHPDEAWEVSHIGGDRFAASVLVLPDGLYYGRLDPESAARMAVWHHDGRLDLDHLRGRSGYSWPEQAAEIFLRRETGLDSISSLRLLGSSADGDVRTSRFEAADGGGWSVAVRQGMAAPERLTCSALRDSPIPTHTLVSIEPVPT
jgi:hypothetical protein